MNVVVVDLEMCQPSKRIIQIGAVFINLRSGTILEKFNVMVNPEEQLSAYIIELTGITQKDVNAGVSNKEALEMFWNWTKNINCKNIQAWGGDVQQLINESKENLLEIPEIRIFNIKELATVVRVALPNTSAKGGLVNTMETLGLTFEGRPHNALTDSINTARLLFYIKEQFRQFFEIKKILK